MEIPVLEYLDVLIGLAVVMVLASGIVLAVVQFALNSTFARARHLERGLNRLVLHIDPAIMRQHAPYLSQLLLRHPMIGQQTMFTPWRRAWGLVRGLIADRRKRRRWVLPPTSAGSVVQREELAYLLVEFAAGEGPLMDPADEGTTPAMVDDVQQALAAGLANLARASPRPGLNANRELEWTCKRAAT